MKIKTTCFLTFLLAFVLVVSAVENKETAEKNQPESAKTVEESKWGGGGGGCYRRCCGYYRCRCCAENVAPNEAVFVLNKATGQYELDYHGGGWGGRGMDEVDHYGGGGGWGGGGRGGGWGGGGRGGGWGGGGRGGGWGGGGRGGGWGGGGGMDHVDRSGGGGPP